MTEHQWCVNVWFRGERSLAEYFNPNSAAAYLVGLHYLVRAMKHTEWTQAERHVVTRDPRVTMMFVVEKTRADQVGVAILLLSTQSIHTEVNNPKMCPSLPHASFIPQLLKRARLNGVSLEALNQAVVQAAILIQILSREYSVELNQLFPSPYDPRFDVESWIEAIA